MQGVARQLIAIDGLSGTEKSVGGQITKMALFEGFDELAKVAETGSVYGVDGTSSVNGAGP